jgi:hypothetical protein
MHRKNLLHRVLPFALVAFALNSAWPQQQDKSKRPSPPGTAECTISGKKVIIEYSRPSMKGRKVMGELVPYGQVWRARANEATKLTTEADLNIGGAKASAGKYTLYTLPSEGDWKLIINKQTGQWGTVYNQDQDLVRVDMKRTALEHPLEQFTIVLRQVDNNKAELTMEWENTRVSVPVKAQ